MKGEAELLPCPFCQRSSFDYERDGVLNPAGKIVCCLCHARGPHASDWEAARDAWNRRASIAAKEG